jgi:exosortase N
MNISMPAFLERNSTAPLIAIGFGLAYLCMLVLLIPGYFVWDANTCLGLALIPYLSTANKGQLSLRYLLSAGVALIIAIMLPVNTLYFIAMVFALLLLIENWIGKISQVVLLLLLLISPVFKHLTHLVEFPVRLWLTEQVAGCLNAVGMKAIALGNQIQLDQYEFSVDPACAGLNMLVTSLIMCLFITAFYQRQLKRQLNFICLAGLCVITIVLNVVCNYFRILILVMFKIMPGTFT